MKIHRRFLLPIAIPVISFLTLTIAPVVKATPYASGVTNNNGTIQFYVNESGGNITVTYEDGSTNANFNGITTGVSLLSGAYSFSLAGHTSYAISVFKVGSGNTTLAPNVIQNTNINTINGASFPVPSLFVLGDPRGVAVNRDVTSPYFGRLYASRSEPSAPNTFLYAFNSDGSFVSSNSAGVAWNAGYSYSPDKMSIGADDSLILGDGSPVNAGIWKIAPDLSTNTLLLGPVGDQITNSSGQIVHGEVISTPLLLGYTNNQPGRLMWIDADYPGSDANAILICTNVMTNSLPYETPPLIGPEVGLNIAYLGNVYPGLIQGPNGYIYASNYRNNYTVPDLDIYDSTGTNILWTSLVASGTGPDYFVNSISNGPVEGLTDVAVSPDDNWLVGLNYENHFTICGLTNGIPNIATLYTVSPSIYSGATYSTARQICFDAADNIYFVSSGEFCIQEWTLGLTETAVTAGNANGVTNFQIVLPNESVSVTSSNSLISQANSYGNPTNTFFVLTRTGATNGTLSVSYTLAGTAFGQTNGSLIYPASVTVTPLGSVIFQPGQTTAVVTVTAVADSTSRPTTSLAITLATGSTYTPVFPTTAAINILNTAPEKLLVGAGAPSMYNAYSNDYVNLTITRWGDTNAAAYVVNSFSIIGGTAVEGTDYTAPTPVTIHPGDLTDIAYIYPLIHGQLPIHTNNLTYSGNKTIIASVVNASGYTVAGNTNTFTIVDSANPPATVLYYDPLTNSAPTNWVTRVTDENYPNVSPDYYADFGYNLSSDSRDPDSVPISTPPSGAPVALRLTTGKGGTVGNQTTYSTAVNLYPTNVPLTGNFAVRFNINITEPASFATSGSFEGPLFGIDCSGTETNWYLNSSPSAPLNTAGSETNYIYDGVWVWLTDCQYSQYDPYTLFALAGTTNSPKSITPTADTTYSPFLNNFKAAVFSSPGAPGLPGNGSPEDSEFNPPYTNVWADVELKQFNNVVTLSINKTHIIVYTNATVSTNGDIMLGYETPVFGGDGADGAVYYSDLKVVQLGPPAVSGTVYNATNSTMTFNFTTPDGTATPSQFVVVGVTNSLNPPLSFSPVSGATVTQSTNGSYQATIPVVKANRAVFYRIQEQYQ